MRKPITFAKVMTVTTIISFAATAILALLYFVHRQSWLLTVLISTGTTFYHFAMRMLVGFTIPQCIKHPMRYNWFQPKSFERKLYQILKVKQWKDRMPTYDPTSFSLQENSLQQIAENCCISEAVHKVIVLFSFVPLVFSFWWGAFPVFLTTSLLAAALDCCFAIMQRYNRPRLLRILAKKEGKALE